MTQSSVWVAVWPPEKTINAYRRRRIYVEDCQWQRQQRRSSSILICNCIICELTNWSRNDIQQFEVFQFFPFFLFCLVSNCLVCGCVRACVCLIAVDCAAEWRTAWQRWIENTAPRHTPAFVHAPHLFTFFDRFLHAHWTEMYANSPQNAYQCFVGKNVKRKQQQRQIMKISWAHHANGKCCNVI